MDTRIPEIATGKPPSFRALTTGRNAGSHRGASGGGGGGGPGGGGGIEPLWYERDPVDDPGGGATLPRYIPCTPIPGIW